MKNVNLTLEPLVFKRLTQIEEEIESLKALLKIKRPAVLRGIWKGLQSSEKDFRDAKRSLAKHI